MNDNNPPLHVLVDAGIAVSSVVVPLWIYQLSVIAGCVTAVLGVFLVFFRLLLAIRDWKKP